MKKLFAIITICFTASAFAESPINFQQLLNQAQQGRLQDSKMNTERLRLFKQKKAEQSKLLNETKAAFKKEQLRTKKLEKTFEKNDLTLSELEIELHRRQGRLKELLGTVQQQTGDTLGQFESSIISAQLPQRISTLIALQEKMSDSSNSIAMADIRTLWVETLQEIIESGKVVDFIADVTNSSGLKTEQKVTRIGLFNSAITGNNTPAYLTLNNGHLTELQRQPSGAYTDLLGEFNADATGSIQAIAIDPTRGQLLAAQLQKPDLLERFQQGGFVGYIIALLGAVALLLGMYKITILTNIKKNTRQQLNNLSEAKLDNPLGRVIQVRQLLPNMSIEDLELKLSEAIHRETPRFSQHHNVLKIIAVVAPLMGLLGTVVGMIITFQSITLYGTGDPKLMAGGISSALITTVLGLVVAIPTLFIHNYLSEQAKSLTQTLEQQAIGQLALQTNK